MQQEYTTMAGKRGKELMLSEKEIRERADLYTKVYWANNQQNLTDFGQGYLKALCDVLAGSLTDFLRDKEINNDR